jgi:hypothetical protein
MELEWAIRLSGTGFPWSRPVAPRSASAIFAGAGLAGTAALGIELGGLDLLFGKVRHYILLRSQFVG